MQPPSKVAHPVKVWDYRPDLFYLWATATGAECRRFLRIESSPCFPSSVVWFEQYADLRKARGE